MHAISVQALRKSYPDAQGHDHDHWSQAIWTWARGARKPRKEVLKGVDLTVRAGECFGLLGVNGAGKTTLIKTLCGLIAPDSGQARVWGFDVVREPHRVKAATSVVKGGGWVGLLFYLNVRQNLEYYGALCGLSRARARRRAGEVIDQVGLGLKGDTLPWHLSAGQRQALAVAMCLMVRTPIVFLDEPTVHLDPHSARRLRELARETLNRREGRTVVLSTHYLAEAEALCDRIAILHEGRILTVGMPDELKARSGLVAAYEVHVAAPAPALARLAAQHAALALTPDAPEPGLLCLRWTAGHGPQLGEVLAQLTREAVYPVWAGEIPPKLEDAYLHLIGEASA
ncbi:MAG TPA: ABC transporter ATP-binding protein [Limnochordia bacterium]|nr:ABC transporter ATP-binding protein [Limnochordia bacterium]